MILKQYIILEQYLEDFDHYRKDVIIEWVDNKSVYKYFLMLFHGFFGNAENTYLVDGAYYPISAEDLEELLMGGVFKEVVVDDVDMKSALSNIYELDSSGVEYKLFYSSRRCKEE